MQINAPKEKPETQHWLYPGFSFSIQSSAAAASESSPWPLSNIPSLLSTPLKFILITEKLFLSVIAKITFFLSCPFWTLSNIVLPEIK